MSSHTSECSSHTHQSYCTQTGHLDVLTSPSSHETARIGLRRFEELRIEIDWGEKSEPSACVAFGALQLASRGFVPVTKLTDRTCVDDFGGSWAALTQVHDASGSTSTSAVSGSCDKKGLDFQKTGTCIWWWLTLLHTLFAGVPAVCQKVPSGHC